MTQRVLVAAALFAASSLAGAGAALADCNDGHTVAGKETPSMVSVQPTLPAPKPEAAKTEAKAETEVRAETRTAEAKPAVR